MKKVFTPSSQLGDWGPYFPSPDATPSRQAAGRQKPLQKGVDEVKKSANMAGSLRGKAYGFGRRSGVNHLIKKV
ncbi:hypothetical protein, partial [Xanthomonas sp. F1]